MKPDEEIDYGVQVYRVRMEATGGRSRAFLSQHKASSTPTEGGPGTG